jgi:hypothetical protein
MLFVDVSALLWPDMHSSVIESSQFEALESRTFDDADPRPLKDLPWPALKGGCWIGSVEYLPDDLVRITPWSTGAAYGVGEEGNLVISHLGFSGLSVAQLCGGIDAGYLPPTGRTLAIVPAPEVGNGFFPVAVVEWLALHFPDVLLVMGAEWSLEQLLKRRNSRIAKLAKQWVDDGIEGPGLLQEWIDKRDIWSPDEVGRRLRIAPASARILLEHLGYVANGRGVFVRIATKDAMERRAEWFQAEEESMRQYFGDLDDEAWAEDEES